MIAMKVFMDGILSLTLVSLISLSFPGLAVWCLATGMKSGEPMTVFLGALAALACAAGTITVPPEYAIIAFAAAIPSVVIGAALTKSAEK
jgi:hypothetical protein